MRIVLAMALGRVVVVLVVENAPVDPQFIVQAYRLIAIDNKCEHGRMVIQEYFLPHEIDDLVPVFAIGVFYFLQVYVILWQCWCVPILEHVGIIYIRMLVDTVVLKSLITDFTVEHYSFAGRAEVLIPLPLQSDSYLLISIIYQRTHNLHVDDRFVAAMIEGIVLFIRYYRYLSLNLLTLNHV